MPASKIEIPRNVEELLDLASDVYKKHQSDGDKSPLNSLQDHDWSVEGPRIATALLKHKEAEELKRKSELAYRERDQLTNNLSEILKGSRDVLKGVYAKTPKKLGDWGFTVTDASSVTPAPASSGK